MNRTVRILTTLAIISCIIFILSLVICFFFECNSIIELISALLLMPALITSAVFIGAIFHIKLERKNEDDELPIAEFPADVVDARIKDVSALKQFIDENDITCDNVKCMVTAKSEDELIYNIQINITKTTKDVYKFLDNFEIL